MRHLYDLLQPDRLTAVVHVGANPIDDAPPYRRMLEEGLCTVIGFDPQMTAAPGHGVAIVPKVVGNGAPATMHICAAPGMTSLLPPSPADLERFPGMAEFAAVIERRTVETHRLDDLDEVPHIDLLCMDVQGGEPDVVMSARKKLRQTAAVITEVSFMPLYRGQWTFGGIDEAMRTQRFVPHCFAAAKCWPIATKTPVPHQDPHQILEADIVYVRDTARPLGIETTKHLALIAHHVCGSFDLSMLCVEKLAERGAVPPEAPMQYRQTLEAM